MTTQRDVGHCQSPPRCANPTEAVCHHPAGRTQRKEIRMENVMTVGEMLDALYDGVGCSWVEEGRSFVDEVAAWVEEARASEDEDDADS